MTYYRFMRSYLIVGEMCTFNSHRELNTAPFESISAKIPLEEALNRTQSRRFCLASERGYALSPT